MRNAYPLETKERQFTDEEYVKLETLAAKEKGKEKHVTKRFIDNLKKGRKKEQKEFGF